MPYTVKAGVDGCSGYAVVKDGENSPIPGGCHGSKAQAIAHMVAIQANYEADRAEMIPSPEEPEMEAPEAEQEEPNDALDLMEEMQEYGINARQAEMYEAYEDIAERYGKWLKDAGPDGAHYVSRSPFSEEGLLCSNCVFFQGGRMCEVVAGDIAPEGVCKLWIIAQKNLGAEPIEEGMEYESRAEINLTAPMFMRASARRGLALHEEGKSGAGLKAQTVEDARKMAAGQALSEEKWRKVGPWIARHTVDLDAVDKPGEITPGLVAMLLWGGGASKSSAQRARSYAENLVARLDAQGENREQPRTPDGKFASTGGGDDDGDDASAPLRTFTAGQDDEIHSTFKDEQGSYIDTLSEEQLQSVTGYQAEGTYDVVNGYLRGQSEAIAQEDKDLIETLDGVIQGASLDYNTTVYRGVSDTDGKFANLKPGDTILERGYSSTSPNPAVAEGFANSELIGGKPVVLAIDVPYGQPALAADVAASKLFGSDAGLSDPMLAEIAGFTRLNEVILPRGLKMKVTRVEDKENARYVKVEITE